MMTDFFVCPAKFRDRRAGDREETAKMESKIKYAMSIPGFLSAENRTPIRTDVPRIEGITESIMV